ncbi:porin [Candidatus Halobeggiatoa sp. HSG11]|nr:porin [Candidatus Halobeggiatoa sp. HSG11]
MKKLLVMAAAACMATPAMADTILFGQLHASVDSLDGASKSTSLSSNSSRIGVKGSVALDYGLQAIYHAEWGIDTGDNDSYDFSNRNQVVGIGGNFGAVLVGRHDTPFKAVSGKADLFWATQIGHSRQITNGSGWDKRPSNVLMYKTPKISGVQATAMYITEEDGDDKDAFGFNAIYDNGSLMLGAGYEMHSAEMNGGGEGTDIDDSSSARLIGGFNMAGAKINLFYQSVFDDQGIDDNDNDTFGIGLSYGMGPGTFKTHYYQRALPGDDNNSALVAIGYDHKLGKNTAAYVQYAQSDEGLGLGGVGHGETMAADSDGDTTGVSIGIVHKF